MIEEEVEEVDLYKVLGVKKTATTDEIKEAYKTKAKKLHPDMEGGDEEAFKLLTQAYEVLMDEELRPLYDTTGETEKVDYSERIMGYMESNVMIKITSTNGFVRVDLIEKINESLNNKVETFLDSIENTKSEINKVKFVYDRIRLKEGENVEDLFHEVLDEKLSDLESEIKFFHMELNFVKHLRDFINKYEYILEDLIEENDKSIKRYSFLTESKDSDNKDEQES